LSPSGISLFIFPSEYVFWGMPALQARDIIATCMGIPELAFPLFSWSSVTIPGLDAREGKVSCEPAVLVTPFFCFYNHFICQTLCNLLSLLLTAVML